jgi:purine-binding chemotaxis protein CheW
MYTTAYSQSDQFLTFFLADEEYAVSVLKVTEIIECSVLTKVPGAPPWVRGVISLRGSVVPVVDLAIKFGLPQTAITLLTCIVVVEIRNDDERLVIGVMADAVHQVLDMLPGEIQPSPVFGPGISVECIHGLGSAGGKFVVILDIDHILSTNELLVASMAAGAGESSANIAIGAI